MFNNQAPYDIRFPPSLTRNAVFGFAQDPCRSMSELEYSKAVDKLAKGDDTLQNKIKYHGALSPPLVQSTNWSGATQPFSKDWKTSYSPAVAVHLEQIWCVWMTSQGLVYSHSQDHSLPWLVPTSLSTDPKNPYKTNSAPVLVDLNDTLYAFWIDPTDSIIVQFQYDDSKSIWLRLADTGFKTSVVPTATIFQDTIYLAYLRQPSSDQTVMWSCWTRDSATGNMTWPAAQSGNETSWGGPSLVVLNDVLHILFSSRNSHRDLIDIVFDPAKKSWSRASNQLSESSASGVSCTSWLSGGAVAFPANWTNNKDTAPVICLYRNGVWNSAEVLSQRTQDIPIVVALDDVLWCWWLGTDDQINYALRVLDDRFLPSSWMSDVVGTTSLNKLCIPGTHDSATSAGGPVSWYILTGLYILTQNISIYNQLRAGCRFLDLRLGLTYGSSTIIMMHGDYIINWSEGGYPLSDVLSDIYTFLKNTPTETIFVSIMEQGTSDTSTMASTLKNMFNSNSQYWYGYNTSTALPSDLDAARGKIILLNRTSALNPGWGIDMTTWPRNSADFDTASGTINVQDDFNPSSIFTETAITQKWTSIQQALARAVNATDGKLYINYASANQGSQLGADPRDFAMGIPGLFVDGINDLLKSYFDNVPTGQAGVFPMDFPEQPDDLITAIIEANFAKE
ncbi:1-phosphatidylinositol phosphodiesterase [Grifola frondosa]|uniref:1-phosphatidylinositol phosphodiesterase n=1 Tax=Grifola frondosa TaxID=5627 RepID=A0A1C7LSS6_GRIFR|nr:1-phosphatidylinositol phosphodiesterase [Grifola frondosa]